MKKRKDFYIALFILFGFGIIGVVVQRYAMNERMKISRTLQPKDSLGMSFNIDYINKDGDRESAVLAELPYTIKIFSTVENSVDLEKAEQLIEMISDRGDVAFFLYHQALDDISTREGIFNYTVSDAEHRKLRNMGDLFIVDSFNDILQMYDAGDDELFNKLVEDVAFALPMVDYKKDKLKEGK